MRMYLETFQDDGHPPLCTREREVERGKERREGRGGERGTGGAGRKQRREGGRGLDDLPRHSYSISILYLHVILTRW